MVSIRFRVVGLLVVAAALACTGCRKGVGVQASKNVSIDTSCHADPDEVPLSYSARDQVVWKTPNAVTYTITFKQIFPPFGQSSYTLQPAGSVPSGQISTSASVCASVLGSCKYKYSIAGSNGCSYDPKVIINP